MSSMYFRASDKAFFDFKIDATVTEITLFSFINIMDRIKNGYELKVDSNGYPYTVKAKPVIIVKTLSEVVTEKLNELNVKYEEICDYIRGTYPNTETGTWPVQLAESMEYRRWVSNGSVPEDRPILILMDPLANERDLRGVGDGLADLVDRVINNAMFYNTAIAKATAIRHASEQAILLKKSTGDKEGIASHSIDFNGVIIYLKSLGL